MIPILRLFFCLLALFSFSHTTSAQDQKIIDSLTQLIPEADDTTQCNIYVELYRATFQYDLGQAGEYASKCVEAAERSGYLPSLSQSHNLLGIHLLQISDYDAAVGEFQEAIAGYQSLGESERVLRAMNNLAIVYEYQGDLEASLNTHLQVITYLDSLGIGGDVLASSMWNIGNVKLNLLKHEEAIDWYSQAKAIYEDSGDTAYIVDLNYQIALAHSYMGNLEEAEKGFDPSIQYYRDQDMRVALAGALESISDVYIGKSQYNKAEQALMEALSLANNEEAGFLPGQIYRRLLKLYLAKGDLQQAEKYGLLSIDNAKKYGRDKKIIGDYQLMAEVYEKQNRYALSLDYFKKYHAQNDSIFGLEKLNAINALELEYQEYKNQQEVKLLEEQNRVSQLKQNGLMAGILGLVAIFGILVYGLRQRLSKNKIAKEKVEQELNFHQKELEMKKQELTAYALQVAHKNEVLEGIKTNVSEIKEYNSRHLQKIINTINFNQHDDDFWEGFRQRFLSLHKDFESNIQKSFPDITPNELRLMSLLKMNLSSKEIANVLNVSADGIKKARYRLRKKLGLATGDSLENFIIQL